MGKGAHEEHELPALVLRQAVFERGHGPAAFADLIEDFAIGDVDEEFRVGKIGGKRVMRPSLGTVPLAAFSVTLCAFVGVDLLGGVQVGLRRRERILEVLIFRGDDPRFILLDEPVDDEHADEKKKRGEKQFAELKRERRVGGH